MKQHILEQIFHARKTIQNESPLIHCITGPIAINDCANAILALGGKAIMAELPDEAHEITTISKALSVSLANITEARAEAIKISGSTAYTKKLPMIIDIVGVSCSSYRIRFAKDFINRFHPDIIKGNASEIKALMGVAQNGVGIDAGARDTVTADNSAAKKQMAALTSSYARQNSCVVMVSGASDVISDGDNTFFVENGVSQLTKVTGTGCMLNVITALYASAASPLAACITAAVTLGICGELAYRSACLPKGLSDASSDCELGTFHYELINKMSSLTDEDIARNIKLSNI